MEAWCTLCNRCPVAEETWDAFVAAAPGGDHVQSAPWSRVKQSDGWGVLRLGFFDGVDIVAGAQLFTKKVPLLGTIGYLDEGPLTRELDQDVAARLVDLLRAEVARHRIRILVVQPARGNPILERAMRDAGFVLSHVRISMGATVLTDLAPTLEQILGQMSNSTRRNIRKATRGDLFVRVGGEENLPAFLGLLAQTGQRQGFTPDGAAIVEMVREFAPDAEVVIVEHEGEPIAGNVTIRFGDRAVSKRGAWTGTHGKLRPNELVEWESIGRAKEKGVRWYDFDGMDRRSAQIVLSGAKLHRDSSTADTGFKLGFGEPVLLPEPLAYVPGRALRLGHHLFGAVHDRAFIKRLLQTFRRT